MDKPAVKTAILMKRSRETAPSADWSTSHSVSYRSVNTTTTSFLGSGMSSMSSNIVLLSKIFSCFLSMVTFEGLKEEHPHIGMLGSPEMEE